jgi:hypothetical protein
MARSTDFAQEYQQAEKAYMQGRYEEAADIVDRLVDQHPQDPSARLLRGHIYCYGLQRYDVAIDQYRSVLDLTQEPEFLDYANSGLSYAQQCADESGNGGTDLGADLGSFGNLDLDHDSDRNLGTNTSLDDFLLGDLEFDDDHSSGFGLSSFEDDATNRLNPNDSNLGSPVGGTAKTTQAAQVSDPFSFNDPFDSADSGGKKLDAPFDNAFDPVASQDPLWQPSVEETLPESDVFSDFDDVFADGSLAEGALGTGDHISGVKTDLGSLLDREEDTSSQGPISQGTPTPPIIDSFDYGSSNFTPGSPLPSAFETSSFDLSSFDANEDFAVSSWSDDAPEQTQFMSSSTMNDFSDFSTPSSSGDSSPSLASAFGSQPQGETISIDLPNNNFSA